MGKEYLDLDGTGKFLSKLKDIFSAKSHKHVKSDISDFPTLGTASTKDVASSGNASTSQVVMGNDTRLSDARKASDVSAWAKASTKPTYTASEVGLGNVGNFKAVSTVASQGLTDTEKSNARANIGAQVAGSYASASHNHDDRYYTESEINTKLNGKANSSHTHGNGDITSLDASKITSGTISIDRLPQGALERLTIVADDTARFKLTSSNVQKGDTVKVTATSKMYYVVDESKLSTEDGYEVYTAGSATSVPWSGVTGKPSTYTPSSHTHDDRYYTESEVDTKLNGKANSSHTHSIANITNLQTTLDGKAASNHTHSQYLTSHQDISGKLDNTATGADSLLSKVTNSWTDTPTDDTYFIRQDTGGGNTFGRVKFSTLWSYIKGKADKVYATLNHTHTKSQITDFPTSMPASDVSSWAKASTKPSYTKSEVGLANVDNTADANKSVKYATSAGSAPANGGTATASNYVNVNNTETKNVSRLQYFQKSDDETIMPSKDWYSLIRCQHPGYTNGYWQEIAFPFVGGGRPQVRQNVNGTKSAWKELAYRSDIPSSLPANGGNASTVNGHTVNSDVPSGAKFTDTNTWRPQPDWNATSGDAVIKNKPTIPSVGNGTVTITQNGTTKGTFTMNQGGNTTIALTDTNTNTWTALKGATTSAAGTAGYAPAPSAGAANRYLRSDGTWSVPPDNNTTYSAATQSANGLLSASDKKKLDGIASGANAYSHPTTSGNKHIPSGGSSGQILRWSADGTAVWGADNNTTYSVATTSANGLMSKDMVTKLNGITAKANTIEVWSTTEPTDQSVGSYWLQEY